MPFPYDPWCNTCGKDIEMHTWNENDGDCDKCKQWWKDNEPAMSIDALNKHDVEVLRILNGEDVPGWRWGAAMSVCCEHLKGLGYAKGSYDITDKGKAFLENLNGDT